MKKKVSFKALHQSLLLSFLLLFFVGCETDQNRIRLEKALVSYEDFDENRLVSVDLIVPLNEGKLPFGLDDSLHIEEMYIHSIDTARRVDDSSVLYMILNYSYSCSIKHDINQIKKDVYEFIISEPKFYLEQNNEVGQLVKEKSTKVYKKPFV